MSLPMCAAGRKIAVVSPHHEPDRRPTVVRSGAVTRAGPSPTSVAGSTLRSGRRSANCGPDQSAGL